MAAMSTPPSARLRSGSRLAQLLRSSQPSISDTTSEHDEDKSGASPQIETRSTGSFRPRAESTPLGTSVASSMNLKTPARSYFHRSFHGSIGGWRQTSTSIARADLSQLQQMAQTTRLTEYAKIRPSWLRGRSRTLPRSGVVLLHLTMASRGQIQ